MKVKIKVLTEVEIKTLSVKAGARYWEDGDVNGVEDTDGTLIPCRDGNYWCPEIDIDTGRIMNWKQGVKAELHYKVCDDGYYDVKDINGKTILSNEGYVPKCMSPKEKGYGDYIIMDIDENGMIADWEFDVTDFQEEED